MIKPEIAPASIGFEESVCDDDDLPHDRGDRDFCRLSRGDELLVLCLEVRVVSGGDEGRHIERLPHVGASAADEARGGLKNLGSGVNGFSA